MGLSLISVQQQNNCGWPKNANTVLLKLKFIFATFVELNYLRFENETICYHVRKSIL